MPRRFVPAFLLAGASLLAATPAQAFFHEWEIKEIYSNADGSIQFIELFNPTAVNTENLSNGVQILATSDGVTRTFTFNSNIPATTANKHLLIATPGFASLLGAVTPDFALPCGPFFNPGATSITIQIYAPQLLLSIDSVTFPGASLPTNGTNSLTDTNLNGTATLVSGASSPTNFAGGAGALALTGCLQTGACDACDDGFFCNGQELCSGSTCVAGPGCIGTCDEGADTCDLFDLIFDDGFDSTGFDAVDSWAFMGVRLACAARRSADLGP